MAVIGNNAYDLKRVAVIVNGVPLGGAADGDFVTITPAAETYSKTAGARGEYAVSRTNDNGATITFNLFQGSRIDRGTLESLIRTQRTVGVNQATLITIQINDLQTGERVVCSRCWIEQEPTRAFGQAQQGREYVFACDEYIVSPL